MSYRVTHEGGFAYTVATGRLFCPMDEFQHRAEALLDRPVLTHELGLDSVWTELREAFEESALDWYEPLPETPDPFERTMPLPPPTVDE